AEAAATPVVAVAGASPSRTPTTTSARSLSSGTRATQQQERGSRPTSAAEEEDLDPQHRAGGVDRLQGREPAAAVHVGARQDPRPSGHRQLHAAAAAGGEGDPPRARDGAPALQRAS